VKLGRAKFPSVGFNKLLSILERHCGSPIRINGSHRSFKSPYTSRMFVFTLHPKDEMWGVHVRKLLVSQLGLSEEAALEEVSR
jgi:predicted RNA binding protein YcfA (HicA-like mRNA interferase family)